MSNPEQFEFKTRKEGSEKNLEEVREDFREHERFGAKVKEILNPQEEQEEFSWEIPFKEVGDIKYITKEGKILSIQELLPTDWKLVRRDILDLAADRLSKKIKYNSNLILNKGFFLGLLHEIGHAHFFESLDKNELSDYMSMSRGLRRKKEYRILASEEEELYKNYVVKEEKKSWAYALKTLRHLRKQGIDLAPELTSIKEILSVVMACLASYEKDLSREDREDICKVVSGEAIEKGEKFLKEALRK